MKEIIITYADGAWSAVADPPVKLEDKIILFTNEADRPSLILFDSESSFGIKGIVLAAESGFTLIFRGVGTGFRILDPPRDSDTHNPTIPPGSLLRRKG